MNRPDSGASLDASDRARSSRRSWLLLAGVGAAAAGAGLGLREYLHPAPPEPIDALWQLELPTPEGARLNLASLKGRPLLVNFWATWCPPCVEEMPLLDRFHQENATNGWQVLGLAADSAAAVRSFLQRVKVGFPIALAGMPAIELSKSLGNTNGGLPFSVAVSAAGVVTQRKIGRLSVEDLQRWRKAT